MEETRLTPGTGRRVTTGSDPERQDARKEHLCASFWSSNRSSRGSVLSCPALPTGRLLGLDLQPSRLAVVLIMAEPQTITPCLHPASDTNILFVSPVPRSCIMQCKHQHAPSTVSSQATFQLQDLMSNSICCLHLIFPTFERDICIYIGLNFETAPHAQAGAEQQKGTTCCKGREQHPNAGPEQCHWA